MSFKRDGDDKNLLSLLQRRRIKDLLAEDVPVEEAKLLSNGRFACLVCLHHPIFDTIAMLCVHRDGKKHKSYAQIFEKKKQELKLLISNRQQEQYSKGASTTIPVASSRYRGLTLSSPYDSRVHKHKLKKGSRKLQVDLHGESSPEASSSSSINDFTSESESTSGASMSSTSNYWHQTARQQLHQPIKHDFKLKNIFNVKSNAPLHLSPYESKSRQSIPRGKSSEASQSQSQMDYFKKDALSHTSPPCDKEFKNHASDLSKHLPYRLSHSHVSNTCQVDQNSFYLNSASSSKNYDNSSQEGAFTDVCKMKISKRKKVPVPQSSTKDTKPQTSPTLAEKYYQLQGSGWKRDWDGKWIKDEQAEFDSDEEPPDIP